MKRYKSSARADVIIILLIIVLIVAAVIESGQPERSPGRLDREPGAAWVERGWKIDVETTTKPVRIP